MYDKVRNIKEKIKFKVSGKYYYNIDGFNVNLGNINHGLQDYQRMYKMYDRFLPYLSQCTSKGGLIIDIGANVGDTVASMVKHTEASFLCIEAADKFYDLLVENVNSFGDYSKQIVTKKCCISLDKDSKVKINTFLGTGTIEQATSTDIACEVMTLEDVINKGNIDIDKIEIVKCDTDGNDYSCIKSMGKEILTRTSALLYWENLMDKTYVDSKQKCKEFCALVDYLEECSYCNFLVFDNFGNFLLECGGKGVKQLLQYGLRMETGKGTRTFFYLDILACKTNELEKCQKVINQYSKDFS